MNIIYFGNRDYWDIKTNGHTRFENIFKSLVKLDKYQEAGFYLNCVDGDKITHHLKNCLYFKMLKTF